MSEKRNHYYEMYVLAMNIIGASEEARNSLSEKTCNEIEDFARRMISLFLKKLKKNMKICYKAYRLISWISNFKFYIS